MSDTVRVIISADAKALLDEMANAAGATPRQYLEALLHYAGSCYNRPGSWEANCSFDYGNYTDDGYADRWFYDAERKDADTES